MATVRYDGIAEWYDQRFAHYADLGSESSSASLLARLLGPGDGWCLDVACGTGLHGAAAESTGRRVVGVDISRDQLLRGRHRMRTCVLGDAARLPFADCVFPAVVCTYLHTDTEDIAMAFQEVARVLRPGGRFVYLGVHPCFWGHFVEQVHEDTRLMHSGYWEGGWHHDSAHWSPNGLRGRVGVHHVTLAGLMVALVDSGLRLTGVEEADRSKPFPDRIALTALKH